MQGIIGTHWIENGRVKKDLRPLKEGKCTPCRSKAGNIFCKKVKTTTTFKSKQNFEDISQYKLQDRIFHLSYGVCSMQPIICR